MLLFTVNTNAIAPTNTNTNVSTNAIANANTNTNTDIDTNVNTLIPTLILRLSLILLLGTILIMPDKQMNKKNTQIKNKCNQKQKSLLLLLLLDSSSSRIQTLHSINCTPLSQHQRIALAGY